MFIKLKKKRYNDLISWSDCNSGHIEEKLFWGRGDGAHGLRRQRALGQKLPPCLTEFMDSTK